MFITAVLWTSVDRQRNTTSQEKLKVIVSPFNTRIKAISPLINH